MTDTNETIADIIAEMLGPKFYPWGQGGFSVEMDLTPLADRLEAAWKRERATTENSSAVGDAAKLREVLEHVEKLAREFACGNYYISDFPKMLFDVIRPALAAPPRNCDVGTADEQTERFVDFTRLCFQSEMVRLAMNWAQMPYEEGGAK